MAGFASMERPAHFTIALGLFREQKVERQRQCDRKKQSAGQNGHDKHHDPGCVVGLADMLGFALAGRAELGEAISRHYASAQWNDPARLQLESRLHSKRLNENRDHRDGGERSLRTTRIGPIGFTCCRPRRLQAA